jgi:hypothetical protein
MHEGHHGILDGVKKQPKRKHAHPAQHSPAKDDHHHDHAGSDHQHSDHAHAHDHDHGHDHDHDHGSGHSHDHDHGSGHSHDHGQAGRLSRSGVSTKWIAGGLVGVLLVILYLLKAAR